MAENKDLIPFEGKPIRKVWHNDEWYFSVVDVIEILTDSKNSNRYWTDLKRRSEKENGHSYAFCVSMKLAGTDGRKRLTDCANTEGILRIVMSVPSPKAEPLRLWLAQIGKQAIDEAENPELLTERHAKHKSLDKQNLRDHMTPIELIFSALGEEATRLLTIKDDAQGYAESHEIAVKGGRIAGEHVKGFEERMDLKVVSSDNFLGLKGGDKPDELPPSGDTPTLF